MCCDMVMACIWPGRAEGVAVLGRPSLDGIEPGGVGLKDYLPTANSKYSLTKATWAPKRSFASIAE
jgi:hypothetical protein